MTETDFDTFKQESINKLESIRSDLALVISQLKSAKNSWDIMVIMVEHEKLWKG